MKPFKPYPDPQPVLTPDHLYLGDNGRAFCGEHAGTSALYTGRDISGMEVDRVTPSHPDAPYVRCERPGCGRRAS